MPTIVPLMFTFGGPAGGGAPTGGGVGAAGACPPGWFIISIVPLNFGAAPPLRLKLHLVHVAAVSGFCVPQFGQNTLEPPFSSLVVAGVAGESRARKDA